MMTFIPYSLAFLSFSLNSLLIILIITKSPKTMGSYKFLMIFMSCFEMIYSLIDVIIQPEVKTMNSVFLSSTSSQRSMLPLTDAYPLLLIWGASFGIALASFGVHFLYRYLIVTGCKRWIIGNKGIWVWLSVLLFSGFVYAFAVHFFWKLSPEMDHLVRRHLSDSEGVPENEIIYFSSYPFKTIPKSPVVEFDWLQIYGIIFLCTTVSLSFFTMIYFGVRTYTAMRKFRTNQSDSLSSLSTSLQNQLFYSLVIQTIIPLLLIHFPTTVIYISSIFDSAYPVFGQVVTLNISLFPAIDPLPSLIIIKPYRQAVRNCFNRQLYSKGIMPVEASTRATSTLASRVS